MLHILTLTYLQNAEAVAAIRPRHVNWVRDQIDAGRILIAGPKTSGGGGVIVTANLSDERVDELIATDPWVGAGIVRYDRVSVDAKHTAPGVVADPAPHELPLIQNVR